MPRELGAVVRRGRRDLRQRLLRRVRGRERGAGCHRMRGGVSMSTGMYVGKLHGYKVFAIWSICWILASMNESKPFKISVIFKSRKELNR